jgi:hypothetical protein
MATLFIPNAPLNFPNFLFTHMQPVFSIGVDVTVQDVACVPLNIRNIACIYLHL